MVHLYRRSASFPVHVYPEVDTSPVYVRGILFSARFDGISAQSVTKPSVKTSRHAIQKLSKSAEFNKQRFQRFASTHMDSACAKINVELLFNASCEEIPAPRLLALRRGVLLIKVQERTARTNADNLVVQVVVSS